MRAPTLLLVVGLGACVGVGGGALAHALMPRSPVVRGVFIGERRLPDHLSAATWLAARNEQVRERVVHLRHEDQIFDATLAEAGIEIDIGKTIAAAAAVGRSGSIRDRVREAARARRGEIDVPLVWRIHADQARALLERVAPSVARAPVDARLDLASRAKIPDQPGRALDVEASLEQLLAGRHDDEETIDLLTKRVPAHVTVDDLIRVDVGRVVASFETTFVTFGSGAGRAVNIRNAAQKLDGVMLGPGDVLSFNEVVGARTLERGFTLAPEIQGDETVTGVGGGTCQLSSTLHAAALFGALGIVERQGHSRPSAYTKMGLDATVKYPTTDLKIKNTLPFPVMIHSFLPKETVVRVEILGGDPVAEVDYKFGIGHTEDFTRRIYVKPNLAPGRRIRHQKGSRGYDVTSVVTLRYLDGRVEERKYFSGYRPAPEIFWVAPGYDEAEMPPLPDHAKGVEPRIEIGGTRAAASRVETEPDAYL